MLLVLVRHARPVVDPAVPSAQWRLGDEGLAAAARLGARTNEMGIEVVVSSLEPKAIETGRAMAEALDVTFHTADGLHEHARSSVGYLSQEVFEASLRGLFERPAELVFGDETGAAAEKRFGAAVDALVKSYRDAAALAVVAHGTVMSLHLAARYGLDGFATWRRLGVPSYVVVDPRTRSVVDVVDHV